MLTLLLSIILSIPFQPQQSVEEILKDKMTKSTECWNEGDLECFMQTYWKSDSLKFIGGNGVTYGWENTLQKYKVGYPTEKERGLLSFTFLSVEPISKEVYFMVGKYHLELETSDGTGHFSLVWKFIDGDWVIIADHSSN
ncbi:MAG: nuclear transport factor 2 family protein [Cyclobacteriaceae bacterium]|nr:nuclear transport factor 2 family protein [Cyclobacteriaceae bacterium]